MKIGAIEGVTGVQGTRGVSTISQAASAMSGRVSGAERVTPVTPTKAVTPRQHYRVSPELPSLRRGEDPTETSVRTRIEGTAVAPAGSVAQAQAAYGGVSVPIELPQATTGEAVTLPALNQELGQVRQQITAGELGQAQSPFQEAALPAGFGRMTANGEFVPRSPEVSGVTEGENHLQGECQTCLNRKYVDGSDDGSVSFQTPTHIAPEQSAAKVMAHEQEHVVNEQLYAERDGREVISQSVQIFQDICPDCGNSYTSGGLTTTVTAEKQESQTSQASQTHGPDGQSWIL